MELSRLLRRIRNRWREDPDNEFFMMSDSQIDEELQRKSRVWNMANRKYAADAAEGVAFPPERLEKHAQQVERDLLLILMAFLAGELSKAEARRRGLLLIEDHLKTAVAEINEYYLGLGLSGQIPPESDRVRKALKMLMDDFEAMLDAEDYWATPEGVKQSTGLLALLLVYSASAAITESVARASGAVKLVWVTMGDPAVCQLCLDLAGEYDLDKPIPEMPAHLGCRCHWEIRFREAVK